ncbi:hypothetical protein N0V94_002819 [Neodidymelliopsis sp. IMI 364377]|nr:hypothetical protein N0V94_002819 [Neodidymelliopsis sp. IMI 364377]
MSRNSPYFLALPDTQQTPNNAKDGGSTINTAQQSSYGLQPIRPSALHAGNESTAFQHPPVRLIVAGTPAQEHPSSQTIFLRNLPAHSYILPSAPLSFTMVEIIVFLPNLFKNRAIASRFSNNQISAPIHFAILDEHRNLGLPTEHEKDKARKTIADRYRRTMRTMNSTWTKATHIVPPGWDTNSLAMGGFVPDEAARLGYTGAVSIPFRDLIAGVKKLPEGTDAGDLTRTVIFALHQPEVYLYPNDLPAILDYIGRTYITTAHTDPAVIRRYTEMKQRADHQKKYPAQPWGTQAGTQPSVVNVPPPPQKFITIAPKPSLDQRLSCQLQASADMVYEVDKLFTLPDNEMAVAYQMVRLAPASEANTPGEEMDDLLRPHLTHTVDYMPKPPKPPAYAQHHLLRDCIEGRNAFDSSDLARAARLAQQPDQLGTQWRVEDVNMLVQLLNETQLTREDS